MAGDRQSAASRLFSGLRQHRERAATIALLLVAAAALLANGGLALFEPRRVTHDEATYLTQVLAGEPAAPLTPDRARGVTFLLVPVAIWGAPLLVVRMWLALISSLGLFIAFRPWVRTSGWAVPLAALLFAGNWAVRGFAADIYPNYWTALGFVAAAGHLAIYLDNGKRRQAYAMSGWIAFTALMRPSDAFFLAAGLVVITLLLRRRLVVVVTVALALGGFVGVAPWLAESYARFGSGPIETVFSVGRRPVSESSNRNVMVYANNLEGPARCVRECRTQYEQDPRWELTAPSWSMMLMIGGFFAFAMARPRRARVSTAVYVAAGAAMPQFFFYLTCNCAVNVRYMLPVYGLVTISVAAGIVGALRMIRTFRFASVIYALLAVTIASWLQWQAGLTGSYFDRNSRLYRDPPAAAAAVIDQRAGGRPCAVATDGAYPQIQYWSDCLAMPLRKGSTLQGALSRPLYEYDLRALASDGYQIYVLSATPELGDDSPVVRNDWARERLTLQQYPTRWLFTAESPEDVPPAPLPRRAGADRRAFVRVLWTGR